MDKSIGNGFKRIAKASNSKIKSYLLKRVGLSTHDIRLFTKGNFPLCVYNFPSTQSWSHSTFFTKIFGNTQISIVNCSNTDPVICEVHMLVQMPNGLKSELSFLPKDKSYKEIIKSDTYSDHISLIYKESDNTECFAFNIPVLKKGTILSITERLFNFEVNFPLDTNKTNNHENYYPEQNLLDEFKSEIESINTKVIIYFGLVLDNEELLPFQWNHVEQRFIPGFFSDGTVVS